jgi:TPR repeat protein
MNANRLRWILLFLVLGAAFQLPAHQSEADRKLLADIRAKAEQGDPQSQFELGAAFFVGRCGVAKDEAEAVKWYRKAADQNIPAARYNLGVCYALGHGVARDDVEAVKWYRRAAEQNYPKAQYNLGLCYDHGEGVAKDEAEAVKWYRRAAEQNAAAAQNNLSRCYYIANGVPKDYVEAYKWVLLAAGQGDEPARENMTMLEGVMTQEQIAEGQKLARNFKPRVVPPAGGDSSSTDIAQTRPEASGTGFFITEDGFLVTNEHVVKDATQIRLVTSTGFMSARVVKVDSANDLALLKVAGKFAALAMVSSRAVKMGSTVATVGFPNIGLQGFAPKLAKGEIAALSGAQDDSRFFQISVPVQPGNSGGALVDERGNVVGVVSAKLSAAEAVATSGVLPENVNYAVKSSFLLSFLESVPDVSAKLKEPNAKESKFEDVVKSAEQAAALVLVY